MAKSQQTWNKKEIEKKKQKKREDKEQKKEKRRVNSTGGGLDNMIAYVDENGNLSSTPPDPSKKIKIKAENIEIGVPRRESVEKSEVHRTGIVTFFNESKGFGFIKDTNTQESIFTHVNGHIDHIKENDHVSFQIVRGQKGLNAIDVKLVN
jgi:cold shock CspA family protein